MLPVPSSLPALLPLQLPSARGSVEVVLEEASVAAAVLPEGGTSRTRPAGGPGRRPRAAGGPGHTRVCFRAGKLHKHTKKHGSADGCVLYPANLLRRPKIGEKSVEEYGGKKKLPLFVRINTLIDEKGHCMG